MSAVINELISAIFQLAVFVLIPFVFFLFRKDKAVGFLKYIGLYKPTTRSVLLSLVTVVIMIIGGVGAVYFDDGIKAMFIDPNSVTGKLRLMGPGVETVLILLIIAVLKTSLSEEILFRGFIANRMISIFGFSTGNIIQALIFGLVHLLLFWKLVGAIPVPLIFIFVFSTLAGLAIGLIKDKYGNGSIIPGWIAHATGNVASYSIFAFVM